MSSKTEDSWAGMDLAQRRVAINANYNQLDRERRTKKVESYHKMLDIINQFRLKLVSVIGDSPKDYEYLKLFVYNPPKPMPCWVLYDDKTVYQDRPHFWSLFTISGGISHSSRRIDSEIDIFVDNEMPYSMDHQPHAGKSPPNIYTLVKIFDGLVRVAEIHEMSFTELSDLKLQFDSIYAQCCRIEESWAEKTREPES